MAVLTVAAEHEEEEEDTRVLQVVVVNQLHGHENARECVLKGELEGELEGGTMHEAVHEAMREPVHEPALEEVAAPNATKHAAVVAMHSSPGLGGLQPEAFADCEGPEPTLGQWAPGLQAGAFPRLAKAAEVVSAALGCDEPCDICDTETSSVPQTSSLRIRSNHSARL